MSYDSEQGAWSGVLYPIGPEDLGSMLRNLLFSKEGENFSGRAAVKMARLVEGLGLLGAEDLRFELVGSGARIIWDEGGATVEMEVSYDGALMLTAKAKEEVGGGASAGTVCDAITGAMAVAVYHSTRRDRLRGRDH